MVDDHHGASGERILVRIDRELEDLIPGYLWNRRSDLKSILSLVDAGDYEEIRVLGHSLKGSGAGYGFDRITEIGSRMEAAAKVKDDQAIRGLTEELSTYLEQIEVVYE